MTHESFEELVRIALTSLPTRFQEVLNNVDVVIEDEPSITQRRKMRLRPWTNLLGLYEGIPLTERRNYTMVLPDKITIFKGPIERTAEGEDEVAERVRRTVLHEIGHHLGMSDRELRKVRY